MNKFAEKGSSTVILPDRMDGDVFEQIVAADKAVRDGRDASDGA